jgi:hypothetical protein
MTRVAFLLPEAIRPPFPFPQMVLENAPFEEPMAAPVKPRRVSPPDLPQTFAGEADRRRLTPAALEAMRGIARRWKLTGDDMAALLGVSTSTWDRIAAGGWKQALSQDQLTRVSAIVGVFKGLHLLFVDGMADRWPTLANRGPLFAGRTPVATMIEGGIPAMLDVRRHVDGLRGGL